VWAAVSFAKACGGVFQDETGTTYPTLEDAITFAAELPVYGPEFFFEGELVGLFIGADGPRTPGAHCFEPSFGSDHTKMMDLLSENGSPQGNYEGSGERISFTVKGRPDSDALELDDFKITRLENA
jgi:hypothetical protein